MSQATSSWIDAGPVDAIPSPGARQLRTAHGNIAVVHTSSGAVYAIADSCPHKGGPLSQGMVFGERVQCPMHGLVIELATGAAVAPDTGAAATYPVRIEAGRIYIDVAAPKTATVSRGCGGECACAKAA
jgi:nitrite reductase (NADH) small subunit